jgi:nicotinamidase-related amidase
VIIHVFVGFRPGYPEIGPNDPPLLLGVPGSNTMLEGTWGGDFHDELRPAEGDCTVRARRLNAFWGTDLDVLLRGRGIDSVIVAGVPTNFVVESTVRGAGDAGYRVFLARDCCSSLNEELHDFAVSKILPLLATVATGEEIAAMFD